MARQYPLLEFPFTVGATPITAAGIQVKMDASGNVVPCVASTDQMIGVAQEPGLIGQQINVIVGGIAAVLTGAGGLTPGALVTSDASGNGVPAAPGAGVNAFTLGYALEVAAVGAYCGVLISQSRPQG